MNKLQKRLARMDAQVRKIVTAEPEFFGWIGDPWTPEQMAQAIRRYPNAKSFSRPLLPEDAEDQVLRCDVWPEEAPRE